MKTKLDYMHVLTDLPTRDLQEMFDDELWDIQIRQDFEAGKFDQMIQKARQEFALFPEKHVEWEKDWNNILNKDLDKIMGIRGDD
jgi:hypothetical protein